MIVDIICAAVLFLFCLLGAWRGFVRQVFSLLAFVLIALFAVPLGVLMASPVIKSSDWGPGVATHLRIGFALGAALAIYIVVKVIGAFVDSAIGKHRADGATRLAPWNRYWGAALGVVKAAVVCWLVLSFFAAFPKIAPAVAAEADESWAARTTRLHNPFDRWIVPEQREDMEDALIALWQLKRHPTKWDEIVQEKSIQRVLKHERIAEMLESGNNPVGALADEDLRNSLREIDWENIAEIANAALADVEGE